MAGSGAAVIEVTAEGRAEVEAALRRRDLSPRVRERLEMVKAAALGRELRVIVEWSGRGERTVVRWLGAYAFGGVGALCDAPRSGRPVSVDRAYVGALGEAVDTPPRSLGLGFDGWTSDRLSAYLASGTPGAHQPWVAARGRAERWSGREALPVWEAEAHALASAGRGGGEGVRSGTRGGGGKRWPRSQGGMNCTTRTRATWRRTRICAECGTGWASSRRYQRRPRTGA